MLKRFLLPLLFLAQPALAMPIADFRAGDRVFNLNLGFLSTAGFDYAVTEKVSLGLEEAYYLSSLNPPKGLSWMAGQMTYQIGQAGGLTYGVTLSGGWLSDYVQPNVGTRRSPVGTYPWLQPALNVTYRPAGGSTLRGLWGPMITGDRETDFLTLFPRLEWAIPLSQNREVTLSSNGSIGWRGFF